MTAPGRIPCIRPGCRRTAPAEKYAAGVEIVCGKCWRTLPAGLRETYRQLAKRRRQMRRLALKPDRRLQAERLIELIDEADDRNWGRIRAYLAEPEQPVGLDAFLDEIGLAG